MTISYHLIEITFMFIALDIVTGFLQAAKNRCIDSQIMKQGLFHKCGFALAIVLACLCEYAMVYIDLGFTLPLQSAVCGYIISTELVSNLENIGKISPELCNNKFMALFKSSKIDIEPEKE